MLCNTLGLGVAANYVQRSDFNPYLPTVVKMRARITSEEFPHGHTWNHYGLGFGVALADRQYALGFGPSVTIDDATNHLPWSSNTSFHEYRLDCLPVIGYRFYVDGALIYSAAGFVYPGLGSRVFFGDTSAGSNGYSQIAAFEFYQLEEVEVLTVKAAPTTLWVDPVGMGSGILFKAEVSGPAEVQFSVAAPDGRTIALGTANTSEIDGKHIALKTWWGIGTETVSGIHYVTAAVGGSSKTFPFTVVKINGAAIGMGKWMRGKDPHSAIPQAPEPYECPAKTWPELVRQWVANFNDLSVNDPVNIRFGTFIQPETDLTLKSHHPLVLARIYNSLDFRPGPFGVGWSSPYLSRLSLASDVVTFVNADGGLVEFRAVGQNWTATSGIRLSLRHATDTGFWTVSQPQGSEWTFDEQGRIIRMAQACCGMGATDAVLCEYNADGHLSRVSNAVGQWLSFVSDAAGHVTGVTDSAGRTLAYTYSEDGHLLSFTDPIGRVTTYAYTEEGGFLSRVEQPGGRVTEVTYSNGRVSTITAPDGAVSRFTWDFGNPKLTVTDPNGTAHEYRFSNDWVFSGYAVPALGITKGFTLDAAGGVTRFQNSQGSTEQFTYSPIGALTGITDVMGQTSTFEYHPTFQKVTKKTDALGRVWLYAYCQRGNLISETDPAGGVTTFRYDAWNNRTSRTDPLGRVTRYVYSPGGAYLTNVIDPEGGISTFTHDLRGNLISSTDPLGRETRFEFDPLDRLTKTIYPDGRFVELEYDQAGNVALRRDQLGRETHFTHNLAGRLLATTRPDGTTLQAGYDSAGHKITETDALGRVTRFEYSPIGLLTKTIYPDGSFETLTYDTESRLVSRADELGHLTNLEYDPMGRLLATIDPAGNRWESVYDAVGRKTSEKDPLGRVTRYELDALDRTTKVIRPDGTFVSSVFDGAGNLLTAVDALGNSWNWLYDGLNRQVRAIRPDGASSTTVFDAAGQVIAETDPLGRTTQMAYDNGGRRISTTDALGFVWRNTYDQAGRLVAVTNPLGGISSMTYDLLDRVIGQADPLGNLTAVEFDAMGRRVAKTDAQGRRSITAYDLRDRVVSGTDPEGRTVSFGYNAGGQRVRLTDGANRTWRWEFDTLGRVVAEIDPLGNTIRSGFDAVGNRISRTNARGEVSLYTFDSMNRMVQEQRPDGSLATMTFDAEGREVSRSDAQVQVTKTWDTVGNMVSETFGPWGKTWTYAFDLAGNRIQAVSPEGETTKYRFDGLNRLVELDPPNDNDEILYAFDPAGRRVSESRPGVTTTQSFDAAGRLLELKHERSHGTPKAVGVRQYAYSPVGNRLSMTDEEGGKTAYQYDGSDWLTGVVYPDGRRITYAYNGAGDRLTETLEVPTVVGQGGNAQPATVTTQIGFSYDPGGRMIARASDSFNFDSDGNLTQTVENGEATRYGWSADNRLLRVEKDLACDRHGQKRCHHCQPQVVAEDYGYLPLDWRRVSRKADGQEFVSVFDQNDESHEYQVKSGHGHGHGWKCQKHHRCGCPEPGSRLELLREFVGGPGTDDLELTKYHGRTLSFLKDALGSTIALTNRGGHAVAKIGYDAWGNLAWPDKPGHGVKPCHEDDLDGYLDRLDGSRSFESGGYDPHHFGRHHGGTLTPVLYTGRRWEGFSKTYNNRNRYYNPRFGRFITKDPIGFGGGNNLWGYANNNPVLYIDPFGEDISDAIILLGSEQGIGCDLAGAYELEDWDEIYAIGLRLARRGLLDAYYEVFRDPELFWHRGLLLPGFVRDSMTFVTWSNSMFEPGFEARRTPLPVNIAEAITREGLLLGLRPRDQPPRVERDRPPKDYWHINMVSPKRSGNVHVPVPEKYVVPNWL